MAQGQQVVEVEFATLGLDHIEAPMNTVTAPSHPRFSKESFNERRLSY